MTPQKFIEVFDTVAEAPGGIERLRELVLQLAVRGKLVPQDAGDGPATSILERNAKKKKHLVDQRKISKPKALPNLSLNAIPFNVPETWQWIRLGDVALVVMGNSPPGSSYNDQGHGVPLVNGPSEFSSGAFGPIIRRKYTTEPKQMCTAGDMLVCVRATTGRTNIAAFDACIGRGVALVRAWDAQQYVNLYLWHVGTELLATGRGTTFPSISYADLAGKPLPLPPLAEQHRIVAKVDELMRLIDQLETTRHSREEVRISARDSALAALRNAATPEEVGIVWTRIAEWMDDLFTAPADLASLRESVLQLAVRGRLVPQDKGDEPVNPELDRIARGVRQVHANSNGKHPRTTELDGSMSMKKLPSGWAWARATVLGVLNPRNKADDDTMASFCPMSSIPTDHGNQVTFETRRWGDIRKGYTHFADGDVVVAKITPCFQNRKSCVMSGLEGGIGAGTTELYVVRVNTQIVQPEYLLLFYKSPGFLEDGVAVMTGTAGQQRVPREYLEHTPLPIPPLAEQHRIIAKVDELMGLIDRLEHHVVTKNKYQETAAAATVQPA